MSHAKGMRLVEQFARIGEVSLAIIAIDIGAGKVADNDQIQIAIVIEVDERAAVGAAKAFSGEAGRFRAVQKISLAIELEVPFKVRLAP
jgi:hypothetical protein